MCLKYKHHSKSHNKCNEDILYDHSNNNNNKKILSLWLIITMASPKTWHKDLQCARFAIANDLTNFIRSDPTAQNVGGVWNSPEQGCSHTLGAIFFLVSPCNSTPMCVCGFPLSPKAQRNRQASLVSRSQICKPLTRN